MPFFTIRPTSKIRPMKEDTFRGVPVTSNRSMAPTKEMGAAASTTSGSTNDRN